MQYYRRTSLGGRDSEMSSSTCNLDKPGVIRLNQIGTFAVIANKQLHDKGKCGKFAVVNTKQQSVDSSHPDYPTALSYAKKLL